MGFFGRVNRSCGFAVKLRFYISPDLLSHLFTKIEIWIENLYISKFKLDVDAIWVDDIHVFLVDPIVLAYKPWLIWQLGVLVERQRWLELDETTAAAIAMVIVIDCLRMNPSNRYIRVSCSIGCMHLPQSSFEASSRFSWITRTGSPLC